MSKVREFLYKSHGKHKDNIYSRYKKDKKQAKNITTEKYIKSAMDWMFAPPMWQCEEMRSPVCA